MSICFCLIIKYMKFYNTFNQVDKNAPRIMEALVFENKRMITLFFKPNIYDDTKNDCHM